MVLLQHSALAFVSCLFFSFLFFGLATCGILVPRPGIEPVPPTVEMRGALTTGLPGKSLCFLLFLEEGSYLASKGD